MKDEIDEALNKDLGYNKFMSNFAAHSVTLGEIYDLKNNFKNWARSEKIDTPLGNCRLIKALGLASCSVENEPLGLVLVISAWNYPIYTSLPQVAAAISAGNSVILKPS
jgi:acyl-CoA reductase-like NAD-dependent aldehyde dehydrogenase